MAWDEQSFQEDEDMDGQIWIELVIVVLRIIAAGLAG